jgi:hypothetical protein
MAISLGESIFVNKKHDNFITSERTKGFCVVKPLVNKLHQFGNVTSQDHFDPPRILLRGSKSFG